MLASQGRLGEVTQVIINPSDEAYFNVISSMSKKEDVRVGVGSLKAPCSTVSPPRPTHTCVHWHLALPHAGFNDTV